MTDKRLLQAPGVRGLLSEVLGKLHRLTDKVDAIAGPDRACVNEYVGTLHPLPAAASNGRLSSAFGVGVNFCAGTARRAAGATQI